MRAKTRPFPGYVKYATFIAIVQRFVNTNAKVFVTLSSPSMSNVKEELMNYSKGTIRL